MGWWREFDGGFEHLGAPNFDAMLLHLLLNALPLTRLKSRDEKKTEAISQEGKELLILEDLTVSRMEANG